MDEERRTVPRCPRQSDRRPLVLLWSLASALALTACASTPTSVPTPEAAPDDRVLRSDRLLAEVLGTVAPGCAAAVAERGQVTWSGARGTADLATGRPLTPETEFDIASVSKQFTATAVLLLAQDGALHLDDVLGDHVPGLPAWSREVTLSQLVHHTAGIPDYTDLLTGSGTALTDASSMDDAVQALREVRSPSQEPGSAFGYSNSHYVLLAEVVEAVAGVPLAEFLQDRVFGPAGVDMRLAPGLQGPDVAVPYAQRGGSWEPTPSRWTQVGDGSIHTTPAELARWADQYRTGAVGGAEVLEAVVAGAVPTGDPDGSRYGAGLQIAADGALSHLGGWSGFVTLFGVTADRGTSIAVSCNSAEVDAARVATGLRAIWTSAGERTTAREEPAPDQPVAASGRLHPHGQALRGPL